MAKQTDGQSFEGFDVPKQNWFKTPNVLLEIMQSANLAEVKVVLYLIRHTWGFQEYGRFKRITVDEFERGRKRKDGSRIDSGAGLSRQSVISGLQAAENRGYVEVQVDQRDAGRIKKYYRLRMKKRNTEDAAKEVAPTGLGVKKLDSTCLAVLPRSEKETNRKETSNSNKNQAGTDRAAVAIIRRLGEQAKADRLVAQVAYLQATGVIAERHVVDAAESVANLGRVEQVKSPVGCFRAALERSIDPGTLKFLLGTVPSWVRLVPVSEIPAIGKRVMYDDSDEQHRINTEKTLQDMIP